MIGIVFQWSSVIPLHCKMFQNSMHSQKIQRKEQRQQLLHWELQTDSCICNYAIMHPRMQNFANRRRTDDGLTCVALCSHLLSYALHPPCHWNHECCCTNTVFITWWHVKSFGRCQLDSVDYHAWTMDKKIFRILLFFAENIVNMHRQSDVLC